MHSFALSDIVPQVWRETLGMCGAHTFSELLNLGSGMIDIKHPTLLVKEGKATIWVFSRWWAAWIT